MARTLTVDGVDYLTYVLAGSLNIKDTAHSQTGVLSFSLSDSTLQYDNTHIKTGKVVVLANSGTTEYAGVIRHIVWRNYAKGTRMIFDVDCQDYSVLPALNVVTSGLRNTAESDATRIAWLFSTYGTLGVTVNSGNTFVQALTATMPPQDYTGKTIAEALDMILDLSGGRWYVDDAKALHTFITESATAPWALSDNPNDSTTFGYRDLYMPLDATGLVNAVYYIPGTGGTAVATWYTDATSIAAYGRREKCVSDTAITTQAALDLAGAAYILANKNPKGSNSLTCYKSGLISGQIVNLTASNFGLTSEPYRIQSVTTLYRTQNAPEFHIQFGDVPQTLAKHVGDITTGVSDSTEGVPAGGLNVQDNLGGAQLSGSGFYGPWRDFLLSGLVYNSHFAAGSTSAMTVTEVGTAATIADYTASTRQNVLPDWVISSAGRTLSKVTATSPSGFALRSTGGNGTDRIYQDIPIESLGNSPVICISRRFATVAATGTIKFYASYRDKTHAIIGSRAEVVNARQTFTNDTNDYGATVPEFFSTSDAGLAWAVNTAYIRVEFEVVKTSGTTLTEDVYYIHVYEDAIAPGAIRAKEQFESFGPAYHYGIAAFDKDIYDSGFNIGADNSVLTKDATTHLPLWQSGKDTAYVLLAPAAIQTITRPLLIPPSSGGAAIGQYGSMPVKIFESSPSSALVDWQNIPAGFRSLEIRWYARSTAAVFNSSLMMKINNLAGTYDAQRFYTSGASSITVDEQIAQATNGINMGIITGASCTAGYFAQGTAEIEEYAGTTGQKMISARGGWCEGNVTNGAARFYQIFGKWRTTATAINRLSFSDSSSGTFAAGSRFELWGIP